MLSWSKPRLPEGVRNEGQGKKLPGKPTFRLLILARVPPFCPPSWTPWQPSSPWTGSFPAPARFRPVPSHNLAWPPCSRFWEGPGVVTEFLLIRCWLDWWFVGYPSSSCQTGKVPTNFQDDVGPYMEQRPFEEQVGVPSASLSTALHHAPRLGDHIRVRVPGPVRLRQSWKRWKRPIQRNPCHNSALPKLRPIRPLEDLQGVLTSGIP